jgi:hypothetical protein
MTSIDPNGSRPTRQGEADPDIDELVDGRAIMALGTHPSSANAPAERIPPPTPRAPAARWPRAAAPPDSTPPA